MFGQHIALFHKLDMRSGVTVVDSWQQTSKDATELSFNFQCQIFIKSVVILVSKNKCK